MSSEHSPTQDSANAKTTSLWCNESTSGPYSHTLTHHGNRTQQQDIQINYKSHKISRVESQPVAHKQPPQRNTGSPSQATHAYKRDTHLHINRLPNTTPTPPPKCSCAQTESTFNAYHSSQLLPTRTRLAFTHTGLQITPHTHTHRLH